MAKLNHKNIVDEKRIIEWDGKEWQHILVIKTNLPLDSTKKTYDSDGLNSMVNEVSLNLKSRKNGFQKVRIEEI